MPSNFGVELRIGLSSIMKLLPIYCCSLCGECIDYRHLIIADASTSDKGITLVEIGSTNDHRIKNAACQLG